MRREKTYAKAGDRFARLVLLERAGREECGNARWKVRCDCGTEFVAALNNIVAGHTRSCGCLRVEMLKNRKRFGKEESLS